MFQRTTLVFYLIFVGIAFAQNAPAYLWGSASKSQPALTTLDRDSFASLIAPNLEDSMVLVFLENDLETKDFAKCKNDLKESCFENLKQFKLPNFYANVELPINALKDIQHKQQNVNMNSTGELSEPVDYEVGKIVFLNLDDSGEERSKVLSEHDAAIANVYKKFSSMGKIFAIYTSEPTILSRQIRQVATPKPKPERSDKQVSVDGKFLLSYSSFEFKENDKAYETLEINGISKTDETKTELKLTVDGTKPIEFSVHYSQGYWMIKEMIIGGAKFPVNIHASEDFSYYCGTLRATGKDSTNTYSFKWNKLQMEANFNEKIKEIKSFHDPWHCVGFTSIGIWMGLFVTFMFLLIMSIGITWMMDINTMDRFDDPKGKTITINAE